MSSDDGWPRIHKCLDHAGRPREIEIDVKDGLVTFHGPPGEIAMVHPQAIGALRQDLIDAQVHAINQRGGEF